MTSLDMVLQDLVGPYQLIGHLSYALVAIAFLLRDILFLRMVAMAAAVCNLTFSYFAPVDPNWVAIGWQALFIVINGSWSAKLILERRTIEFSEEEKELYETIFRAFSPLEFMKLLRVGRWQTAGDGAVLAAQGDTLKDIMLIYNGAATVSLPDGRRRRLKDGAFIGEMSFIRGGGATATVTASGSLRYLAWPTAELKAMLARNPAMRNTLQTVFSEDLTKKLLDKADGA